MTELCCENLSIYSALTVFFIMPHTRFRMNQHSVILDIAPVSRKEFLDVQVIAECRFTLKCVRDTINTQSITQSVVN